MPLRASLTEKVGRAYTKVWKRLEGGGTITLLRTATSYDEYDELLTLTGNWLFEFDAFRNALRLSIAENSDDLTRVLGNDPDELTATHVRVDGFITELYEIREGDTIPPKGTDVVWKVFCELGAKPTRFTAMR